jgi:hypothetical protein
VELGDYLGWQCLPVVQNISSLRADEYSNAQKLVIAHFRNFGFGRSSHGIISSLIGSNPGTASA